MSVSTEGIFSGLALWLVPAESSSFAQGVKQEMEKLRKVNRDVCSGEFGIHATLVAGLGDRDIPNEKMKEVTQKAVEQWRHKEKVGQGDGLTIELKDVTTRGSYFQCILIALAKHPKLLSLNSIARDHIDSTFPAPPSYFPHISLLYASLTASQAKSQIQQMHKDGVVSYTQPPTEGKDEDEDEERRIEFRGAQEVKFFAVEIYDCTGTVEEWKKLYSVPL